MNPKLVKQINRIFHEVEAEGYDIRHPEIMEGDRKWWDAFGKEFIKPLSSSKSISILDVGSGTGFVGKTILKYIAGNDTFCCYDLSVKMLIKAKEKLKDSPSDVKKRFLCGDAESLPFKDSSFDVVAANAVLHHLPNYPSLLKEIDRVLKQDGLLAVAHEQNSDFFKSKVFRFMALFYKLIGGGMKLPDSMQTKINAQLKEKKLIKKDLSKNEIMGLVDYHSPIEQNGIFIDIEKGLSPNEILTSHFSHYSILDLRKYSTFFHRPFLEKNKIFQLGLKLLNNIFLCGKGPLFSFVIKKR